MRSGAALGLHDEARAWKGIDWDAIDRLHERGSFPIRVAKRGQSCSVRRASSEDEDFSIACSASASDGATVTRDSTKRFDITQFVGYNFRMSLPELESAIAQLPAEQLSEFARWFEEHLADAWDRQVEADIRAGRLDEAGRKTDAEFEAGRCKPLPQVLES
jgi:hypothetical protein